MAYQFKKKQRFEKNLVPPSLLPPIISSHTSSMFTQQNTLTHIQTSLLKLIFTVKHKTKTKMENHQ